MPNGMIERTCRDHGQAVEGLRRLEGPIERAAARLAELVRDDGHLLLCGNGGSATEAEHWSGEWRGRFLGERRPLRATTLAGDTAALTAIANDYGYDETFARQLRALG